MDEGVKTYLVDYQRELEVSQNDEYIQKLADAGMEITYVTPENKALFAEKVAPCMTTPPSSSARRDGCRGALSRTVSEPFDSIRSWVRVPHPAPFKRLRWIAYEKSHWLL